jgi:tRNA(Arg) A34 adenosine deaminase TadA
VTAGHQDDARWLRRAYALAEEAVASGDQPYGAVLVGPNGEVVCESQNTRGRTGDCTGHAETLACREASLRHDRVFLGRCTIYASTEPCLMCCGAIAWSGVGRLAYGVSQERAYECGPSDWLATARFQPPPSCRDLLANVRPPIEVVGPLLEDEGERPHRLFVARH